MNVAGFVSTVRDHWEDFEAPTFPRNRRLRRITDEQEGMATENVGCLLNYAVSLLEPGECYLEVGTWKGRTLSYAMEGNSDKEFYACDNFSDFTRKPRWYWPFGQPEPKRSLLRVLRRASKNYRVTFLEGDFRVTLPRLHGLHKRVGVYFYDGGHGFDDQFEGLELALPFMASESLIVVDDTNPYEKGVNESEAREANRQWLAKHPEWRLLFDLCAPLPPRHAGWGNGVQVLGRYKS